jgi:hypothetical protein
VGSSFQTTSLATGTLAQLPAGTLYLRVDQVTGAVLARAPTGQPGMAYAASGSVTLTDHGTTTVVGPGHAGYISPTMVATTTDPSTTWYFITVAEATSRTSPLPYPGSKLFFASPDLPSLPLSNQDETLTLTTLKPHGFSPALRPNGVQLIVDLHGTIDLDGGGGALIHLTTGQCKHVLEHSYVQLENHGDTAQILSMYLLSHGVPLTIKAR